MPCVHASNDKCKLEFPGCPADLFGTFMPYKFNYIGYLSIEFSFIFSEYFCSKYKLMIRYVTVYVLCRPKCPTDHHRQFPRYHYIIFPHDPHHANCHPLDGEDMVTDAHYLWVIVTQLYRNITQS